MSSLKGKISILSFSNKPNKDYRPTDSERTIFFAVSNSIDYIRDFVSSLRDNYMNDVKAHSASGAS